LATFHASDLGVLSFEACFSLVTAPIELVDEAVGSTSGYPLDAAVLDVQAVVAERCLQVHGETAKFELLVADVHLHLRQAVEQLMVEAHVVVSISLQCTCPAYFVVE